MIPPGLRKLGGLGRGRGTIQAAKEFARMVEIGGDLAAKFAGAAELAFVAEPLAEADLETALRDALGKIEQVAFDAEVRAVERGAEADVRSGAVEPAGEQSFGSVDAGGGQEF